MIIYFDNDVTTANESTAEHELEMSLQFGVPVLIDFYATWCAPCVKQGEVIEQLAERFPDVKILKYDIDQDISLPMNFNVTSVPTLVLLTPSETTWQQDIRVGLQSLDSMVAWINESV